MMSEQGGLSNALPELVNDAQRGGQIDLDLVPQADSSLSPMETWCNESQERYVLAVAKSELAKFAEICDRERCPYAAVGTTTATEHLLVMGGQRDDPVVDLPIAALFGKPPRLHREYDRKSRQTEPLAISASFEEAANRILRFPSVGSKKFLITIGDRSITGLVAQDQMIGPFQVPVADCAVTLADYDSYCGEAMAMGEKSAVAVINPAAAARLSVAEALTNLCGVQLSLVGLGSPVG